MTDQHDETVIGEAQGTPDVTPELEQTPTDTTKKSYAEIDEERSRAVAQMHKYRKEAEGSKAEKDYILIENAVLKNPETIVEVYKQNPSLAETILQNNPRIAEMVNASTTASQPDIDSLLDKKLQEREARKEAEKIDVAIIDFFSEKQISETSPIFRNIVQDLAAMQPKSLAQAKKFLNALYKEEIGVNQSTQSEYDIADVPSLSTRTTRELSQQSTRAVSPSMRAYMEEQFGKDTVKKHLSSK